ncbi:hypothetical protein [Caloranaerobacter azorensis]|uniref:hypothetical protein n=1 Tax=Caloranaerobacter azorensis TaxID=116090 RepID=UPI00068E03E6|nr:hypothetical protein [Caloranaerobacter azorensis]
MSEQKQKIKKPFYKRWWFITLVVVFLIALIASDGEDSNNSNVKTSETQSFVEQSENKSNETMAEQTSEEKKEPEKQITKYKAGTYKIGTDMPAGEYKLFADGIMPYYAINKDSSGSLDSIISNDSFSNFTYVTVKNGQYLELKGCFAVPVEEAPAYEPVNGKYISGKYKVGFDIPAGEYKVIAENSMAYVEVSKDSLGSLDSIITNDNFENSKYITVKDGQYLKIQNAYIEK